LNAKAIALMNWALTLALPGGLHGSTKKPGTEYQQDISATRLSLGDPLGFPPHSREWFSIIDYLYIMIKR
jgi:hypothetical protein